VARPATARSLPRRAVHHGLTLAVSSRVTSVKRVSWITSCPFFLSNVTTSSSVSSVNSGGGTSTTSNPRKPNLGHTSEPVNPDESGADLRHTTKNCQSMPDFNWFTSHLGKFWRASTPFPLRENCLPRKVARTWLPKSLAMWLRPTNSSKMNEWPPLKSNFSCRKSFFFNYFLTLSFSYLRLGLCDSCNHFSTYLTIPSWLDTIPSFN